MFYSEFKNFNKYFKVYLFLILIFSSIQLYWKHEGGTDSTISEWLINYQGGFVRRGFLGELFFQISIYFQFKIRLVILIFQILIYTSYLWLLYKYINQIKKNFFIVLSIFSPLLIVYHLAEVETLARKEVLLFIHFLILLLFLENKKTQTIYLSLSFPILLLIWEPIIFFSGFYLIIILIGLSIKSFLDFFNKIVLPAIPSLIVFNLILFNNFSIEDQNMMCANLENFVGERCYMSLGYVTSSIFDNYMALLKDIKLSHIIRYVLALIVGFFPIILILLNLKKTSTVNHNLINKIKITKLFLLASFPVLNLFLMGLDWGRWCNIFYFYSFATIFYLVIKKYYFLDLDYINKYLNKKFTKKKIKNFSVVLFIIFSFTWNLKATFKEDIGSFPIYRMPAKTIKNILSL